MATFETARTARVEARIAPDALAVEDPQRFADLLLKPPVAPAMKRAIKARRRLLDGTK
jgi:hypothetical protein